VLALGNDLSCRFHLCWFAYIASLHFVRAIRHSTFFSPAAPIMRHVGKRVDYWLLRVQPPALRVPRGRADSLIAHMSTLVLSPSTFTHPTAKWTPESIARRDDASFVVTWRVEYRGGAERGQTVIHASPEERDAMLSACVADIQATRRAVLDPAVQQQSWGGLTTQRQAEVGRPGQGPHVAGQGSPIDLPAGAAHGRAGNCC